MLALGPAGRAQEFRCQVTVNPQKLFTTTQPYESTDKKLFEQMKESIETFVNQRHWTNLTFEPQEQLDMAVNIILNQRSSLTDFSGQIAVQLRRTVYNSTYTTGLFNYIEQGDFRFSYNESMPLEFDLNNFYGNLQSTLAFYCYVMLGIYFDSYALGGGEPMFEMARLVAQTAENSGYTGWRNTEGGKSRYWFMENHTNPVYSELHEAYYNYHRLGLDLMTKDQQRARQGIIAALTNLRDVHTQGRNILAVQQFVDVKVQELLSIFTPAPVDEQKQVYDAVKAISPVNAGKLVALNGGKR